MNYSRVSFKGAQGTLQAAQDAPVSEGCHCPVKCAVCVCVERGTAGEGNGSISGHVATSEGAETEKGTSRGL